MELVSLRALELDDLDRLHRWSLDREATRTSMGAYQYISRVTREKWLREQSAGASDNVNLAICLADTSEHIGTIHLVNIHWVARHAELRLLMGESLETTAEVAQAAVRLLTKYAMKDLGLLKVFAHVIADNTPVIEVFEACGWTAEVRMRQHAFINGTLKDVIIMGLCADELPSEAHENLFRTLHQTSLVKITQEEMR